ncbi:MAG TPA: hypothetical protein VJ997_11940, partial [Longimicrobiales bacterium]|nr:hypothetical protein [Longimicrobiales bacterium]
MVRKSLLVVMLLAIAAPLAAQDQVIWSSKRPDAQAPFGVRGGQLLSKDQIQVTYSFSQMASKGVWFDGDSLSLDVTLEFYHLAPLSLTNMRHQVGVAFAPTEDLTLMAELGYEQREREQYSDDGVFSVASADDLG